MHICCTYSYSRTYSYICTCAWVQRSDEGVGCLSPSLPSYTLRLGLLRNLGLIDWASCLADRRGPRTRLSLLPNASVMDMCCNAQLLHGSWGSELRISYLYGRHCTNWAISPLPTIIISIELLVKNSVEVKSLPKFIEYLPEYIVSAQGASPAITLPSLPFCISFLYIALINIVTESKLRKKGFTHHEEKSGKKPGGRRDATCWLAPQVLLSLIFYPTQDHSWGLHCPQRVEPIT